MCTFQDQQTVLVCDVAIGQVRERLKSAFGEAVQYTTVDGQGTLVQAPSAIDLEHFQATLRETIAAAQEDTSPAPWEALLYEEGSNARTAKQVLEQRIATEHYEIEHEPEEERAELHA